MPNIAAVLRAEVTRVARKEARTEAADLRKGVTTQRADLALLKRRMQALEQEVRRLSKALARAAPPPVEPAPDAGTGRFSAKGLASHRQRLELSASDCGRLLGVSGQTVYNWEAGKTKPRAAQMAAITAFRAMGKREAATRLAAP